MKKLDGLKKNVEIILQDEERARDYDEILWQEYCRRFSPESFDRGGYIHITALAGLPSMQNVARIRRLIQADSSRPLGERYLPTDERICERRRIAKEDWQEYFRIQKTKQLEFGVRC